MTIKDLLKPIKDYLIIESNSPMVTDGGIELLDGYRDAVSGQVVKTENPDSVFKILAVGPIAETEGYEIGQLILTTARNAPTVTILKPEGNHFLIRTYEISCIVEKDYKERIKEEKELKPTL